MPQTTLCHSMTSCGNAARDVLNFKPPPIRLRLQLAPPALIGLLKGRQEMDMKIVLVTCAVTIALTCGARADVGIKMSFQTVSDKGL